MEMRFVRIASKLLAEKDFLLRPLPQRVSCGLHRFHLPIHQADTLLCLSAFRADCIVDACRFYERYTIFASARFVRIASSAPDILCLPHTLCLSAFRADCIYLDDCVEGREEAFASARFVRIASTPWSTPWTENLSLPQRVSCGLHLGDTFVWYARGNFASARFVRIASAKLHRYCAANLWNTL